MGRRETTGNGKDGYLHLQQSPYYPENKSTGGSNREPPGSLKKREGVEKRRKKALWIVVALAEKGRVLRVSCRCFEGGESGSGKTPWKGAADREKDGSERVLLNQGR